MSASSKKKLRAEESAAKLTERQLAQQKEDKKVRMYTMAFALVMVLVLIVAIVAGVNQTITSRGIRERKTTALTLNNHTLSNAELNYYFIDAVNNFYSQNGSYAAMFGLDLTKPLDEQVMNENPARLGQTISCPPPKRPPVLSTPLLTRRKPMALPCPLRSRNLSIPFPTIWKPMPNSTVFPMPRPM